MTITLTEAKAHLRVEISDDDTYITSLISSAIRNAEDYTQSYITERQNTVKFPAFGLLPLISPLVSVDQITYVDTDGTTQTLHDSASSPAVNSSVFQAVGVWDGSSEVCGLPYVVAAYGESWPSSRPQPEAVSIKYTSGYGTDLMPAAMEQAILLLIGHLYENREATLPGVSITSLPLGYYPLLNAYRVWRKK